MFLFRARCEDPLDLLKMIEIVPREHLHDRFDCLRPPFLMHSTDLTLFGSQRLEQRYVRFAKHAILGEGFSYVALVDSRARLAHNSATSVSAMCTTISAMDHLSGLGRFRSLAGDTPFKSLASRAGAADCSFTGSFPSTRA